MTVKQRSEYLIGLSINSKTPAFAGVFLLIKQRITSDHTDLHSSL